MAGGVESHPSMIAMHNQARPNVAISARVLESTDHHAFSHWGEERTMNAVSAEFSSFAQEQLAGGGGSVLGARPQLFSPALARSGHVSLGLLSCRANLQRVVRGSATHRSSL